MLDRLSQANRLKLKTKWTRLNMSTVDTDNQMQGLLLVCWKLLILRDQSSG
jgi:hypothetical protein